MAETGNGGLRRKVDTLISGAVIVTMDPKRRVIMDGAVAIAGDRIAAVGKQADVVREVEAAQTIDGRRFVITPGLINAHIHVTETLLKGFLPEDLDFESGVWRWVVPLYEAHTPADQCASARLAVLSMLRTGTTCFLEAGTIKALDPVFEALDETGIRGRVGEWNLDRTFAPDQDQAAMTEKALRILDDELARYPGNDGQRLAAWPLLIGHSTNTDAAWKGAKAIADAHGVGISAHLSPAESDPQWYLKNTGKRPVAHLADLGVLGPNVSLTHMVHVDDDEIALLVETGANVIHCPGAALKGGYGTTHVGRFPEMEAAGVTLVLGTDGGEQADLMKPMTLMAGLFKDSRENKSLFPAPRILEMATIDAARVMRLEDQIGSIEPGKKADLVLHDTDRPEWRPLTNPVSQLVWATDGRSVHSVWVDGRRVVDNYHCTTIDEERVYAEAQSAAEAVTARSGLPKVTPWPVI